MNLKFVLNAKLKSHSEISIKKTASKDGLASYCKKCSTHAAKISKRGDRKENPAKYRNYRLKKIYKINSEDYDRLSTEQNGQCAICKEIPDSKFLEIDHDNVTGRIRGLLCRYCNLGLGNFKDDVHSLYNAINYLMEN